MQIEDFNSQEFQNQSISTIVEVIESINSGKIEINGLVPGSLRLIEERPIANIIIYKDREEVLSVGEDTDMMYMASMIKPAYVWGIYELFRDIGIELELSTKIAELSKDDIDNILEGKATDPLHLIITERFQNPVAPDYSYISLKDIIEATCNKSSNEALAMLVTFAAKKLAEREGIAYDQQTNGGNYRQMVTDAVESVARRIAGDEEVYLRNSTSAKTENAHNVSDFQTMFTLQSSLLTTFIRQGLAQGNDPIAKKIYDALGKPVDKKSAVMEGREHEIKHLHPITVDGALYMGKSGPNVSFFLEDRMTTQNGWLNAPKGEEVYTNTEAQVLFSHSDFARIVYKDPGNSVHTLEIMYAIDIPVRFSTDGNAINAKTEKPYTPEDIEGLIQLEIIKALNPIIKKTIADAA